jgi:transposase InsO family protein
VAQLSAVWGGGWFYVAGVLDARTRCCRGFAVHRVLHRGLIEEALREALPDGPRPTPVVFCPRCRDAGVGFPAWALASAAEVATCDSFAAGLREMLTPEAERGCRSQPDVARAARNWIERTYNRRRDAVRLESAA